MTSDFPGDPRPDELGAGAGADLGPAEPGLARLITTLNSGPVGNELAGEQAALAMFRANFRPPAAAAGGAAPADTPGRDRTRPLRHTRRLWSPGFGRLRLAGLAAALVIGGFAAAAYNQALPAPVQQLAYDALHFAGVPKPHHSQASGSQPLPTPAHSGSTHAGRGHPGPSSGVHSSASPSAGPSAKPSSGTTPAGPVAVSAQAAASPIPAGTPATISAVVTAGGKADAGLAVTLMEHAVGTPGWQVAGHATTNGQGQVSFTTPDLGTNARFRVTDGKGDVSGPVLVQVTPSVATSLTLGPAGVKDYLAVSTQYAQPGNVVALQVMQDGSWVTLKTRRLNSSGATTFTFSATKQEGKTMRVVLLPTRFHAAAVSGSLTVPPPA